MFETIPMTIRFADSQDLAALVALAQLDSAAPLAPPALVAEVDGELLAALSMSDGAVIADPFHPTLELIELLRIRAEQLQSEQRPGLLARLKGSVRAARALAVELRG